MSERRSYTIKPKRRGARKPLVIALLVLGMIAAAHAVWSHYAERQLRVRIDALHAAGQLVTPEDFALSEQSKPGNAAADITAAATILDDNTVYSGSVDAVPTTQAVAREAWPYLEASVEWFKPALARIDRTDQKPFASWSHRYQSPVFQNLSLAELNQCRAVTFLLIASSQVEHHRGNDAVVGRRLRQMLYLARAADGSPALVGHLVSLDIIGSVASHIEAVAPDFRVDQNRQAACELIDALLDESRTKEGLRRAIHAERMYEYDMLDWFPSGVGDLTGHVFGYIDQPIRLKAELGAINQCSAAAEMLAASPDWPTAVTSLKSLPSVPYFYVSVDSRPSIGRMALLHYQRLADARLAATALAMRLYVVDHSGQFPLKLEELVPSYLAAIPKDPMCAGGQVIRYLPKADHPVLYSVGTDGVDDGGSEAAMPHKFGEFDEWRRLDRAFYLSLQPRERLYVSPPAGEACDFPGSDYGARAPWERHDPITPDWHPSTQP